jgi:hypothetical protein
VLVIALGPATEVAEQPLSASLTAYGGPAEGWSSVAGEPPSRVPWPPCAADAALSATPGAPDATPAARRPPATATRQVPPPVALALRWLAQARFAGQVSVQTVAAGGSLPELVALGRALRAQVQAGRLPARWLVLGSGSSAGSPDWSEAQRRAAGAFDRVVTAALAEGRTDTLLSLPTTIGRRTRATGLPGWQVLAAAAASPRSSPTPGRRPAPGPRLRPTARQLFAAAPLEVTYLAHKWSWPIG